MIILIGNYTNWIDLYLAKIPIHYSSFVGKFTSKVPISIGDIFYLILILGLVSKLIFLLRCLYYKKQKIFLQQLRQLNQMIFGFYIFFMCVWGINYHKEPLENSFDIENIQVEELKQLAYYELNLTKKYRQIVNENSIGVFEKRMTNRQLLRQVQIAHGTLKGKYPELNLSEFLAVNVKPSLGSRWIAYLGILGYYNPFLIEPNYIKEYPDTKVLFTQMHELAHNWQFASEGDANFVGYLMGINSASDELKFVAHYKAMRSILNKLIWVDPEFVVCFLELEYTEQMKRDRLYELAINQKYSGAADDAFSILNEAYLQLNNQDGLDSYGQFVELLVGFHRKYVPKN